MSGTICYWKVDDLSVAIDHLLALGSHIHRGPMQIEGGMGMCQVTDTFGNLIGLREEYRKRVAFKKGSRLYVKASRKTGVRSIG